MAWGVAAFFQAVAFWADWASFCGFLKMVTFDGDVRIVFVETYNYLSDLSILGELFVGFEYFSVNYLSDLDILV